MGEGCKYIYACSSQIHGMTDQDSGNGALWLDFGIGGIAFWLSGMHWIILGQLQQTGYSTAGESVEEMDDSRRYLVI